MAPRVKRSIIHRPVDKISQHLQYDKNISRRFESTSNLFFKPPNKNYATEHNRPIIDGYYTQVKHLIADGYKEVTNTVESTMCKGKMKRGTHNFVGEQRHLGTVKNICETTQMSHGIRTRSDTDIWKVIFPGNDDDSEEKLAPQSEEIVQLKSQTHGVKSHSDPTGGRTRNAIRYKSCDIDEDEKPEEHIQCRNRTFKCHSVTEKKDNTSNKIQFILNQYIDEKMTLLQDAIQYLNKVRLALSKINKSANDSCRKTSTSISSAQDAIQMLSSKSTVTIEYSILKPLIELLNLTVVDRENVKNLWDLFDHHIPLSKFKFGRLIRASQEQHPPNDLQSTSIAKPCPEYQDHLMQQRIQARKFKDYDTAQDLISPKPGTPLGLSHVDYFLPRVSEDIKTIFRNFDLDERTFEEAWRKARQLETSEMNKVSVENFKKIISQMGVKLLRT